MLYSLLKIVCFHDIFLELVSSEPYFFSLSSVYNVYYCLYELNISEMNCQSYLIRKRQIKDQMTKF